MARKGLWAAIAAISAGVAATAAFLSSFETVLSKPESILTKVGVIKPAAVALTVRLADISRAEREKLVFGATAEDGADPSIDFVDYSERDDEFCLAGKPMDLCSDAPARLQQPPHSSIGYDQHADVLTGPWGPAVPVFDVISVRGDGRDILLTTQRVEYELIAPDLRPYLQIMGADDREGTFTLVRQSGERIAKVAIDYKFGDVIPTGTVAAWYKAEKRRIAYRGFDQSVTLAGDVFEDGGRKDFTVDIRDAITRHFPGSRFVEYPSSDGGSGSDGGKVPPRRLVGVAYPGADDADDGQSGAPGAVRDLVMMVIGTMRVTSADGATYASDFVVPVTVSTERGYGGADVTIDNSLVFVIDGRDAKGEVAKPLSLVLDDASPTVRSQIALLFKRSGRYRIRFVFGTNDKRDYMASRWLTVQAFAPPAFVETYFDPSMAPRAGTP